MGNSSDMIIPNKLACREAITRKKHPIPKIWSLTLHLRLWEELIKSRGICYQLRHNITLSKYKKVKSVQIGRQIIW